MSCSDFKRKLFHYQADELPEDERLEMDAHLDECPGCAHRLEVEEGLEHESALVQPRVRDRQRGLIDLAGAE